MKAWIVEALARFSSDESVAQLVEDLRKAKDWTTRAAVAESLGRIDHPLALPVLKEALGKGGAEAGVVVAVLDALAAKNQWSPDPIQAVAPLLESTYWQVRFAAAKALETS